jgi:hypothetical protein
MGRIKTFIKWTYHREHKGMKPGQIYPATVERLGDGRKYYILQGPKGTWDHVDDEHNELFKEVVVDNLSTIGKEVFALETMGYRNG